MQYEYKEKVNSTYEIEVSQDFTITLDENHLSDLFPKMFNKRFPNAVLGFRYKLNLPSGLYHKKGFILSDDNGFLRFHYLEEDKEKPNE